MSVKMLNPCSGRLRNNFDHLEETMNYRFARLYSNLIALSLVAVLLSACAVPAPAPASANTNVRIGTQPWIGYGPWWIAKEKGIFEKYKLDVELVDFIEDKEVNAAFASGKMDAANLATHTAIKLFAAGLDLKIVLLQDASYEADAVLAPSSVSSISGLKGKKVAFEEGTTSDLLINYALLQNGMSAADIQPVFMPASDAGATLIAGQVEISVTYEPYISAALAQNSDLRLLYTAAERPGLISDVLAVRGTLDPDVVGRLLQAWDEALAFYRSSPEEAKEIIARNVGTTSAELESAFEGVKFFDLEENRQRFNGDLPLLLQDVSEVSQSIGLFSSLPDLTKILDQSYYR
jgi:NitT/TauT family transport system substrate-binding protein